jgi:2-polyprenyl-3-methyl-5-hydroxy-6-metoxy-1,4-benzoquinol methylase
MTHTSELEGGSSPSDIGRRRRIRSALARVRLLQSAYYLALSVARMLQWNERRLTGWLKNQFGTSDPWHYRLSREQQERFASALNMLDLARSEQLLGRCFEIGCAEGIFSRMLASRCCELIAVDVLDVALERARAAVPGVTFETWNLRHDEIPEDVDLIVLMDVLELFPRFEIARARTKVLNAMKPGGLLLIGNSRQHVIFESAWWAKWLLCGGKRIAEYFAADSRLQLIASETQDLCVNTLFRRTDVP